MNVREHRRVNKKMNNREKLARYDTQTRRKTRQKHNTICVGHHYAQTLRYMLYCYPNDCTGTVNNIYLHNFPNSVFDKNRSVNKFGDTFFYMNIIHIKTDINYIPFPGTDQYQTYSYVVI
jgi:hypothetical protein